jgi:Uma2 family endonuclease
VVQPDLAFYREDRNVRVLRSRAVVGAPDMIVEVTTPGSVAYTRGRKRAAYARAGVPWLVLIDVQSATAETYRRTDAGEYTWSETASGDEILRVPPYPDLSVELARIWPG